jgi:hypothetical protein
MGHIFIFLLGAALRKWRGGSGAAEVAEMADSRFYLYGAP